MEKKNPSGGKEDLLWMERGIVLLKDHSGGKDDLLRMEKGIVL